MKHVTSLNGIYFIEDSHQHDKFLSHIKADLSFKIGAHLKNLNDVKKILSEKAKLLGANAVINFKYGQKSRWLAIDDVAFYGKGDAVLLNSYDLEKIKQQ